MKPQEAETRNVKVIHVVFDNEDFSIAYLHEVDSDAYVLGMRWNINYHTDNPIGFPNIGNHPIWMYLPEALYGPTLNAIKGLVGTHEANRLEVMRAIENQ